MRLQYRVEGVRGQFVDVEVDAGEGTTIGELADELATHVASSVDRPTIAGAARPAPNRMELVADAAPTSGTVIRLVDADAAERVRPTPSPVTLTTSNGAPRRLAYGRSSIGASGNSDVVVTTPGVAPVHAVIDVTDSIDLRAIAALPLEVDGAPVLGGVRLSSGALISFGPELMSLHVDGPLEPPSRGPVRVVGRVPAMSPVGPDGAVEVPTPPEATRPPGFPVLSATVPLLMGAALWFATRSLLTAAFVLFSFVFVVAGALESRRESRAEERFRVAEFRCRLDEAGIELAAASDQAVATVSESAPTPRELAGWLSDVGPRIWERCAAGPGMLRIRLGTFETTVTEPVHHAGGRFDLRDEVRRVVRAATTRVMPVTLDLDDVGTVAVVGPDEAAAAVARSFVAQLATLVGPDLLGIETVTGDARSPLWRWCSWLPQSGPTARPRRRLVVADGLGSAAIDATLAETAADPGAVVVIVGTRTALLPPVGAVIEVSGRGPGPPVGRLRIGDGRWVTVLVDDVLPDEAETMARALAGLRPANRDNGDGMVLPARVELEDLVGSMSVDQVVERWERIGPAGSLAAPIGVSAGGILSVDLPRDGPHVLVAGTTGAGKSEMLRTLIGSLSMHHPPERLAFMLVDYKGGSAFRCLSALPHTVGLVTDLTPMLAERALVSLRAEVRRRESTLACHAPRGATDITDVDPTERPPALVVVVDEFATLAQEVPAFVDGMVDIAQRGRSLGIHMILATQRPAGVVSDAIRANTGLRIALRVADPDDSRDVVDGPAAAHLPREIPGRGIVRVGPGRSLPFQAAYSSGPTGVRPRVRSTPLGHPLPPRPKPSNRRTQLDALVTSVQAAHARRAGPAPRRPWLEPLPERLGLSEVGSVAVSPTGWSITLGRTDRPAEQRQEDFVVDLTRGGILVVGSPRSGRSTTLHTIAAAATRSLDDRVEIFAIDAAHGLRALTDLERVGAVIPTDDVERVLRLLRYLDGEMRRRLAGQREDPDNRMLLIDGAGPFDDTYSRINGGEGVELLTRLAAEGRSVGISVAITATRRAEVHPTILAGLEHRIVLRSNPDEAVMLGVPSDVAESRPGPGRAWSGGAMVQIAVAHEDRGSSDPTGCTHPEREVDRPPERPGVWAVPRLPTVVPWSALSPALDLDRPWRLPIGLDGDDLTVTHLDLTHHSAVVAGPPRSGRSTTLDVIARGAATAGIDHRILLAPWRSSLASSGTWTAVHTLEDSTMTDPAAADLLDRRFAHEGPTLIVIDDLVDLLERPGHTHSFGSVVARLVELGRSKPVRLVASAESDALLRCFDDGVRRLRAERTGVLLSPDVDTHAPLLHAAIPRRSDLPPSPGRGWVVGPGNARTVQVALPDPDNPSFAEVTPPGG